ncbi:hypothetical protein BB559_005013 [Furculomyces boomerangus]|uniref:RRM domain-containing protein n=1 Tax=Furculomyces boomerangus TaxID=61424 RepID=A0A2T9YBA7_9FUNG|nr:hypothetical protein BB559_005013 [Furculomyces boomerangus]
MSTKVFVGSLSWGTTSDTLRSRFEEYGTIEDAIVITDRETGRSRGYGFVTFATPEEAQAAIDSANESEFDGRNIRVSQSTPRYNRERRSDYGGRSNYGDRSERSERSSHAQSNDDQGEY